MKPAPHLFSGPNWLFGAFEGKIVPDENFAQFCLKSPLKLVFPKNTFSVWIFLQNRTSPVFLAKQTRWPDWGQKCPEAKFRPSKKTSFQFELFDENGPTPILWAKRTRLRDWRQKCLGTKFYPSQKSRFLSECFDENGPKPISGAKQAIWCVIVLDENFAQFCLKSPLEFVFPKNTFSVWIFVQNRTSPFFLAKRTRWHDWGQKCHGAKFRPSQKPRFRLEFFDETDPTPLFWF